MTQYIDIPTRQSNILDLLFTNNDKLVHDFTSQFHPKLSDHNIIDILVPWNSLLPTTNPLQEVTPDNQNLEGFRGLDLYNANYEAISSDLDNTDWEALWSGSNLEDFPDVFYQTVLKVCKNHTAIKPPKKVNHNSAHERSYRSLLRKKRKLKCRLDCIQSINPNSPKNKKNQTQLRNYNGKHEGTYFH